MRHGHFRVEDKDENIIYSTHDITGDGSFDNEKERKFHLNEAAKALIAIYVKVPEEEDFYYIGDIE